MPRKDKHDSKDRTQEAAELKKQIKGLVPDVPESVLKLVDEQVEMQYEQEQISPTKLTNELFSVAPELKRKLNLSILFACIGEIFAFASYFFAAYAATWILGYFTSGAGDFKSLTLYALLALASLTTHLVLTGFSTTISHKTSFSILARLRASLFEKLKEIPLGYMVENPVAKIKVIIHDKVGELEDWVAHIMPELPSKILHPILCTIVLLFLDWRIGLSIFAPLPLAFLGAFVMMHNYKARMILWLTSYSNVAESSGEYVRGIPVIKAFLQGEKSYKRFSDSVNFYHDSTMKWWEQSWIGMALFMAATMTPLILTLPLALYLYSKGEITISTFLLSVVLPLSVLPNSFAITQSFELYQLASTTWMDIRGLLFMKPQKRPGDDVEPRFDATRGVEFDNVSFSYKEGQEVLKNITFKAEKNQMTAIVGPSGSGKSTIAKLISGYWDVNEGEILVEGIESEKIPFKQLMDRIAYVSQENYLFDVSILDNIKIGNPDATKEEVIAAAKAAKCHDFIMKLPDAYDTKPGDAGNLLSGGEKQRIAIARCILKPSNIVVLDEATAYTDPENEALIQEAISGLIKDKTLIVIAHRLHTIRHADRIIVMDEGKIQAQGKHDDLIENSSLYRSLNKKYDEEV